MLRTPPTITENQPQFVSKLSFLNIFFLKPGLTKTFYLMIDFQHPLDGAAPFMLQNFKTINQSQFRSKLSFLKFFFLNQV